MPDGAADLVADLYRRMPDARITDILLEVDDATRFTEAFTHLRTGSPCRDRIGLLNVLLAEGINLGRRKMAEATTTHGFWELMRIARWHVEGEAYDRALSMVVEAQAALPMAAVWGTGRTASSNGQFFPAAGRGEALNLVNARYGTEPGVKAYSHVSDRFSPFATQTIPATVHEAPYILDGLLMNETGRRVREQYADTGASPTMSSPRARSSVTRSSRASGICLRNGSTCSNARASRSNCALWSAARLTRT